MPFSSSSPISFSTINSALGRESTTQLDFGDLQTELLAGAGPGQTVSLGNLVNTFSNTQQGATLYVAGLAGQGSVIAISADGNTLAVGFLDYYNGRVVIYTRSSGTWSQQAIINSPAISASFGTSVSLSADGNTLAVGGTTAPTGGNVWVFGRVGSSWFQQAQLSGGMPNSDPAAPYPAFGQCLSLSADGTLLAVGQSYGDSNYTNGAVRLYSRTGSNWNGTATISAPFTTANGFGSSVALSGDGTTLAIGSPFDSSSRGSVYIFVNSNNNWTQQGNGLYCAVDAAVASPRHGSAVALNANGNVLAISAYYAANNNGTVNMFTRTGTTWTQKTFGGQYTLNPTVNVLNGQYGGTRLQYSTQGWARFGQSIALTADGNTVVIGCTGTSTTFVFTANSGGYYAPTANIRGTPDRAAGGYGQGGGGQGWTVAVTSNGSTIASANPNDNYAQGRTTYGNVWVFV